MPRGNPDITKYSPKGRKLGTKNKFTVEFKEVLMKVFASQRVGGVEGMIRWVIANNNNRTEFYRFMTKLLPKDMNIDVTQTESGVLLVPQMTMENWLDTVEQYKQKENGNESGENDK